MDRKDLEDHIHAHLAAHGRSEETVEEQLDSMSNTELLRQISMGLEDWLKGLTDD